MLVSIRRYTKDNRTVPVAGQENNGLELIPDVDSFQVKNGNVAFVDPVVGLVSVGCHLQYQVHSC